MLERPLSQGQDSSGLQSRGPELAVMGWPKTGPGVRRPWVEVPALSLISCVTTRKSQTSLSFNVLTHNCRQYSMSYRAERCSKA